MDYLVKINDFEGPMDLLLHLIKKSDIDIVALNVEKIIDQYLDFINQMENLNLDVASEYLAMAAELIEIKSSLLLPKKQEIVDEYEEDPREQLVKRILEYQKYKELTNDFKELELDRKQIYTKLPNNLKQYESENINHSYGDIDLNDLTEAFKKFLLRKVEEKPLHTKITKKEYSVTQRSNEIRNILKKKSKINFEELFEVITRDYVVVTFLSVLDLAKKGEIFITQDNNFSQIILFKKDSD